MDAKLKSLKVADLKEICTRANIPTTTRSTKADLITKILASQPAIDAYNAKYQQNGNTAPSSKPVPLSNHDSILSPPEEVDWTLEEPSQAAPVAAAASNLPSTKPAPVPAKPQSKVSPPKATPGECEAPKTPVFPPATSADVELEKRKARAARFGIALVESSKPKSAPVFAPKAAKAADGDHEKLRARAERFGTAKAEQTGTTTLAAVSSKKRGAAVVEEVDLDEQERRRKRAERFGIAVVGAKA
jgi:SAP domain-containing ribonucleoprotein